MVAAGEAAEARPLALTGLAGGAWGGGSAAMAAAPEQRTTP